MSWVTVRLVKAVATASTSKTVFNQWRLAIYHTDRKDLLGRTGKWAITQVCHLLGQRVESTTTLFMPSNLRRKGVKRNGASNQHNSLLQRSFEIGLEKHALLLRIVQVFTYLSGFGRAGAWLSATQHRHPLSLYSINQGRGECTPSDSDDLKLSAEQWAGI